MPIGESRLRSISLPPQSGRSRAEAHSWIASYQNGSLAELQHALQHARGRACRIKPGLVGSIRCKDSTTRWSTVISPLSYIPTNSFVMTCLPFSFALRTGRHSPTPRRASCQDSQNKSSGHPKPGESGPFASAPSICFPTRRPPTHLHPQRARGNQFRPIQLKRDNGGTSARRQTDDFRSVLAPAKMIVPLLPSLVPQADTLSRYGITSMKASPFEFIAGIARKPEILFVARAPSGFRNDMFDVHPEAGNALRRPAITATMAGRPGYPLSEAARYTSFCAVIG